MASFETLPAEQRAVLSLVLQSGLNYDSIATMLSVDRATVRERALRGLEALVGERGPGGPQRALVADYLLGQLPPRVAEMTMERLERSPADQAWAIAARAQIDVLSRSAPSGTATADSVAPVRMAKRSSRRGGAVLLVVVAAICVSVAIIILGRTGSHGPGHAGTGTTAAQVTTGAGTTVAQTTPTTTTPTTTTPAPDILGRVTLKPPPGDTSRALGVALIVKVSSRKGVALVAQGLAKSPSHEYYAVWLAKGASSEFLGFVAQGVNASGKLLAQSPLPANAGRFSELLVTLESKSKPTSPGTIVLQGSFKLS
jgi:hypothetical protein